MDYLKLFQTHSEYETFVSGGTMVKPNVSHCIQENEVHYNALGNEETRLVITYLVNDASTKTWLYRGDTKPAIELYDKIEIDGTEVSMSDLDADDGKCQLSVGEHTVAYTLKTPTEITAHGFGYISNIINIIIPNGVTSIGIGAFFEASSADEHGIHASIPSSVTSIGYGAFCGGFDQETRTIVMRINPDSTGCD